MGEKIIFLKNFIHNPRQIRSIIPSSKKLSKKMAEQIDYIISGLPFTVLKKDIRETILNQIYDNLNEGGKFITFQYFLDLYKYLKKKYSKLEIKFIPINIPMAFIYVCTK